MSRVMGPVLDVEMQLLNPEKAKEVGVIALRVRLDRLAGILDPGANRDPVMDITSDNYTEINNLIAGGKYIDAKSAMDNWEVSNPQNGGQ